MTLTDRDVEKIGKRLSGQAVIVSGQPVMISGQVITGKISGEVIHLAGYDYTSGVWRFIAVTESGYVYNRNSYDATGNLKIVISDSDIQVPTDARNHWYEDVTLLSSAARTSSGTGSDVDVGRFLFGDLCIDVTAVSGSFAAGEGLRVIVEGKSEVSGKYKTLYDSYVSLGDYITSTTTDWMPIDQISFKYLRVRWTISGTDPSFTFSVSMTAKA